MVESERACEDRKRDTHKHNVTHSGCETEGEKVGGGLCRGVGGCKENTHEHAQAHTRGLTTSEHRLGLKIKHYVIGVGV